MTTSKTLGAYADCLKMMEAARKHGLITIDFPERGKAVSFRQRCYRVRAAMLRAAQPGPGELPSTPYDTIYITLPDKGEPNDSTLTIRNREQDGEALLGLVRDADGNPISFDNDADALEEAALALRKGLGLDT